MRGRIARQAPPTWNLLKTGLQTAAFWLVFLVLLPWAIVSIEAALGAWWPRMTPMPLLGVVVFAGFGVLGLSSGIVMAIAGRGTPMPQDCPRRLVIAGPYRFVRNPMALAGLAQGAGVGLWLGSVGVLGYVVIGGVLWNALVRPWEEADLAERFGVEFDAYRREVWCWVPRWRPYTPRGNADGGDRV